MNKTLIAHTLATNLDAKFIELANRKGLINVRPVLSMMILDLWEENTKSSLRFFYRFEIENWLDLSDSEIEKISESALPCVRALKRFLSALTKKYFECPVKVSFRIDEPSEYGTIRAKIELVY